MIKTLSYNHTNKIIALTLFFTLVFIILSTVNTVSAGSSVIYVNGSSGNDSNNGFSWATSKLTIKNATETVANDGTVNIANGIYKGTGNTGITIEKNMNIIGQSREVTIINGTNTAQIFNIINAANVSFHNLTFANGNADNYCGGAINGNLNYNGILTVNNCMFKNNYADCGGAIYNNDGPATIMNSIFINNCAENGGAIYEWGDWGYDGPGTLNIGNCTFINNTAYGDYDGIPVSDGGAIENNDGTVTITDSTFTNNTAKGSGGAIHNRDTLTIEDCIFMSNTATGTEIYNGGGAIYSEGALTANNCTFTDNKATASSTGGALNIDNLNANNCIFTGNKATNIGGAISSNGDVTVTGSVFTKNSAEYGGAIGNIYGIPFTLNFCRIVGNTATNGNAIYNIIPDWDMEPVKIINAKYNWWGNNTNPKTITNMISGTNATAISNIDATPWLVLKVTANPTTILTGNKSNVSADLQHDSSGNYHNPAEGHVDGDTYLLPITFGTTDSPALGTFNYITRNLFNGNATTVFTGTTIGTAHITASLDGYTVPGVINIVYNPSPTVTAVDPASNAVNVLPNKVIQVTFSQPIKIGTGWIELINSSGTSIPITTSINGYVLTITHTALLTNGKYTLALHTGSLTNLAGNNINAYTTSFTVDTPPTITTTDPANNAVNVPRNKVITVTFNEPIKAGNMWIELYNTVGTKTLIPITTIISGNVLTINHAALLTPGTKYTLALHTGSITNLTGNSLTGVARYFTTSTDTTAPTITTTDPANNAVNVPRNKAITVNFNEPIKAGNMWIELYNTIGTKTPIPITMSISGNVLTINHTALLANGTKYTLAFHTSSITDNAGNPIASTVRYFTTSIDATAPTITSTDPTNNAVNVPRNKAITVTFNEPIKEGNMWIELYNTTRTKTPIPITTSISGNVLTINHAALLANGTKYILCLHTGSVTDLAGNNLAGVSRYFTTGTT